MNNIPIKQFPLLIITFIGLGILAYGNAFGHGFLLDDHVHLIGADNLASVSLASLFTEGFKTFYRPFAFMWLKFVVGISGASPIGYHLFNLILFVAIASLFYLLIRELLADHKLAFLSSCLYLAHPINNMFVNYKTASNNSIYILCMQIATLYFLRFVDSKNKAFFAVSLFIYFLSLLAHEISFLLPLYLFLIAFFLRGVSAKKFLKWGAAYAGVFFLYFLIRSLIITPNRIGEFFASGITLTQYLSTLISLVGWYLSKLIFPHNILFIWDERIVEAGSWLFTLIAAGIFISLVFYLVKKAKTNKYAFVALLFLSGLIPILLASFTYTRNMRTAIIEPHWFGFSSIGFFILLAAGLLKLVGRLKPKAGIGILVVVVLFLGVWTRASNALWKDDWTYCSYWLEQTALNGTPWHCVAQAYARQNNRGLDKNQYGQCFEPVLLGLSYHARGDAQTALNYHKVALDMDRSCPEAYYALSLLYADLRQLKEAQELYDQGLKLDRSLNPLYALTAKVFSEREDKPDARLLRDLWKNRLDFLYTSQSSE